MIKIFDLLPGQTIIITIKKIKDKDGKERIEVTMVLNEKTA